MSAAGAQTSFLSALSVKPIFSSNAMKTEEKPIIHFIFSTPRFVTLTNKIPTAIIDKIGRLFAFGRNKGSQGGII